MKYLRTLAIGVLLLGAGAPLSVAGTTGARAHSCVPPDAAATTPSDASNHHGNLATPSSAVPATSAASETAHGQDSVVPERTRASFWQALLPGSIQ